MVFCDTPQNMCDATPRPANQYDFPVFSTIFQLKYGHTIFLRFFQKFTSFWLYLAFNYMYCTCVYVVYESVQFQVQCGNKVRICTYIALCMNQ